MTPGTLPLALYRGDTYHWRFTFWADTGATLPSDLTGVTPKAEIRDRPGGTLTATLTCTVELPNVIVADLVADESAKLSGTGGSWDLQLTYASTGDVTTVLAGPVQVTVDVTDSADAVAAAAVLDHTLQQRRTPRLMQGRA